MKRLALLLSAVLALALQGVSQAHPADPGGAAGCPCLAVTGNGSGSSTLTLERATTLYQDDISTDGDTSSVSGWFVQDARGTVVAGRALVADGTVYSHSVGERAQVVLPAGRYLISRVTQSRHTFLIPVRGVKSRLVTATGPARLAAHYALQAQPGPAATAALPLSSHSRLLFLEARQESSARIELVHCFVADRQCTRRASTASDPTTLRTASVTLALALRGATSQSLVLGTGLGQGTSVLQLEIAAV